METASTSGESHNSGDSSNQSSRWSVGSDRESVTGLTNDLSQDLLEQDRSIQAAIFGAVYTISSAKLDTSLKMAILRIFLDYVQLWLEIGDPDRGWEFDHTHWLWKLARWGLFVNPIIDKGYTFYIGFLYIAIFLTSFCSLAVAWVAWRFMYDQRQQEWLVKSVRNVVTVFCVYFFTSTTALLAAAYDCRPFSNDPQVFDHLHEQPQRCTDVPHVIHVGTSVAAALMFFLLSFAMSISDFETNPTSTRLLAAPHSFVELASVVCKTVIVFTSHIVDDAPKFKGLIYLGTTTYLTCIYLQMKPHYNAWANHIRTGLYSSFMWMSLMLTISAFTKENNPDAPRQCTLIMFYGIGPVALLFFGISYCQLTALKNRVDKIFSNEVQLPSAAGRHYRASLLTAASTAAPTTAGYKDVFQFENAREVEIASRCCREGFKPGDHDSNAIKKAEFVLRAGTQCFPKDPFMAILNCNFLMEVQGSYQSGYSQLMVAKKMRPDLWLQYLIFVREQQHRSRARAQSGRETSLDLASYVEFQKNFRLLMKRHKDTLRAVKIFWKIILRQNIKFTSLVKAFKRIDKAQTHANKTYQMVLERHPSSVKLLRSYALFLEEVMNDPWRAARYYADADKLELAEEEEGMQQGYDVENFGQMSDGSMTNVNEKTTAVIVINSSGTIQIINKMALNLFGYKRGELEGKNVSNLMPAPFSQRHNGYLHSYINSGREKVFNGVPLVQMLGLHKERYVFPFSINVQKVSGAGDDSVFMGILMPTPMDSQRARIWLLSSGSVLCVDQNFCDWFAVTPAECTGRHCSALAASSETSRFTDLLKEAKSAPNVSLEAGEVGLKNVAMLHKYIDPVHVDITCRMGGTTVTPILMMELEKTKQLGQNLLVTDSRGRIVFVTSPFAEMLNYTTTQLLTMDISRLMAAPFSQFHAAWLKEMSGRKRMGSCRTGVVVTALNSTGNHVALKMSIGFKEDRDTMLYVAKVEKSTFEEGIDQRRLLVTLDEHGIVASVSNSPQSLFGFKPATLVGRHLSSFIDVFSELHNTEGEPAVATLLQALGQRGLEQKGMTWNVGVVSPTEVRGVRRTGASNTSITAKGLLTSALEAKKNSGKPALMQVDIIDKEEERDVSDCVSLTLWRAELATGVLEVDMQGSIIRAGTCPLYKPGPIFGLNSNLMIRQPISTYMDLGRHGVEMLLQPDDPGKRGNLKNSLGQKHNVGGRTVQAFHADGGVMTAMVQACYKDTSMKRCVLRVSLSDPPCGNLARLQQRLRNECSIPHNLTCNSPGSPASLADAFQTPARPNITHSPRGSIEPADFPSATPSPPLSVIAAGSAVSNSFTGLARGSAASNKPAAMLRRTESKLRFVGLPSSFDDLTMPKLPNSRTGRQSVTFADSEKPGPKMLDAEDVVLLEKLGMAEGFGDHASISSQGAQEEDMPPMLHNSGGSQERVAEWVRSSTSQLNTTCWEEDLLGSMPAALEDPLDENAPAEADAFMQPLSLAAHYEAASDLESKEEIQEPHSAGSGPIVQSDYKRGKRCKKIQKILMNDGPQKSVNSFRRNVLYVLVLLLVTHMTAFLVFRGFVTNLHEFIFDLNSAAEATDHFHEAAVATEVIRHILKGYTPAGYFNQSDLPTWIKELKSLTHECREHHSSIFLGETTTRRLTNMGRYNIQDLLEKPSVPVIMLTDTVPPRHENTTLPLWDVGNEIISALQEIYSNYEALTSNGTDLADTRFYQMVHLNVPAAIYNGYRSLLFGLTYRAMSQVHSVRELGMILLVVEGCVVCVAAIIYIYWQLACVSNQRYNLFSVFLMVPSGCVRALATKQIHIGAEEDDDDDKDMLPPENTPANKDENQSIKFRFPTFSPTKFAQGLGQSNNKVVAKLNEFMQRISFRSKPLVLNKKRLLRNGLDTYLLLAPFLLWSMLICIIYSTSYHQLLAASGPIINTSFASLIRTRITRTMLLAYQMCTAPSDLIKASILPVFTKTYHQMHRFYDTLLYGGEPDSSVDIIWGTKGTAFYRQEQTNMFFRLQGCVINERSEAFHPVACQRPGDYYYEVFHHGIDAMMRRYFWEADLLASDPLEAQNITSNRRMKYLWTAGRSDLHIGFTDAIHTLASEADSVFTSVESVHIILFTASFILAMLYLVLMYKPFLNRNRLEVKRISEMLCQLPPEMDVDLLIEQALFPARAAARQQEALAADIPMGGPRRGSITGPRGGSISKMGSTLG